MVTDDGQLLLRGQSSKANRPLDAREDTTVFELDHMGNVSNIDAVNACSCELPPSPVDENTATRRQETPPVSETGTKFQRGCMLCGQALVYLEEERPERCVFCGNFYPANAVCEQRHFVCIIIPVYGEADRINQAIGRLKSTASQMLWSTEIIVVDGDPEKRTLKAINARDVIKTASRAGRGVQMNHGARIASADLLLFLHADTVMPANALKTILHVLGDKNVAAGAFDLVIGAAQPGFRIIEKGATLRSRITRIPFGDQAIFFKAQCFWA